MRTEKKYLIYGISLILLTLIGVSLAYFVTEIVGDKKTVSVSTGDLRIVFTNGDDITGNDIEPGWNTTKTFSVENKTNSEYKYNIVIEDLISTFSSTGYLVYKITSSNGYNMEEYIDVPKGTVDGNATLAFNVNIPSKTIHNYTLEIKYLNDKDNSQNIDMNSTLSGKLYINEGSTPTLTEAILRDNPIVSERTNFSVTNTNNTTGTIYKTNKTEDDSTVYYYSGNTTNNWVKFGKEDKSSCTYNGREVEGVNGEILSEEDCLSSNVCEGFYENEYYNYVGLTENECVDIGGTYLNETAKWENGLHDIFWRIIRTNEDGSVRLLYAGSNPNTIHGYIGESAYSEGLYTVRIGYMYGDDTSLDDSRANTTDNTIKKYIDEWYQNNLLTNYDKYISKNAIYCNDRSVGEGTWADGFSANFGAYTRLYANKAPTYKCGGNTSGGLFESTQAIEDKFSASTTGGGNGKLTYGVALMTADEASFAGGVYTSLLSSPIYYSVNGEGENITGEVDWWLLSPFYITVGGMAYMYSINSIGSYGLAQFNLYGYVRPVLSISSCAKVTGSGTPEDPYIIDEQTSTC